jgi:pimeloyl-ACP methyl ester carboxylesterase
MPKVKVDDINMYYEIHGEGEPLVFISGAGVSHEPILAVIPMYVEQFKCILFDNRGIGKTDAPDIPYTTEMMADDLAGLLDVIGISKANISGTSMGGMIAQQFAIHYPERVNRLILMCTTSGGPKSIPINELDSSDIDVIVSKCMTQQYIAENPEMVQNFKSWFPQGTSTVGMTHQGEAVMNHNTYESLSKITAPTLIIVGDSDEVIPHENSKILASLIPNSELVILPNAGHVMIEAGIQPHTLSIEFLKGERITS